MSQRPGQHTGGWVSARPRGGWGNYRSDVHIRFDVPADPAYPGRVAAALASVRLRRFSYIGAALAAVGAIGLALSRGFSWGEQISPLWVTLIVGGVLSMLYWPWVRLRARRRSSGYAVEGAYDITDDNIMMRSGSESGGIAWDGVAQVRDTPDFWIVYVDRMPATVIPRWLMSAEDAETLRAHMAERGLLQRR
nr:YcxB family protein [Micromonospora jinlongensis]